MGERDSVIAARAGRNAEDFNEHGPRLSMSRSTWIVARSDRGWVMRGGLGAFGMGRMWCPEHVEETVYEDGSRTPPDSEDPTYAEAPLAPGLADDFGATICECGEPSRPLLGGPHSCDRSSSGEPPPLLHHPGPPGPG